MVGSGERVEQPQIFSQLFVLNFGFYLLVDAFLTQRVYVLWKLRGFKST